MTWGMGRVCPAPGSRGFCAPTPMLMVLVWSLPLSFSRLFFSLSPEHATCQCHCRYSGLPHSHALSGPLECTCLPVSPASGPPDRGPCGSLLLSGHGDGRPARRPWAQTDALTPWEAAGTGVLLRTQYLKHEMHVHSFGISSSVSDQWNRQPRTERRREQKPMVPARGHRGEPSGSRDAWLGDQHLEEASPPLLGTSV